MNTFYGPGDEWRANATSIVRPLTSADYTDWCQENCEGKYQIGISFIEFELEADAVLYRLRWT